jgi:lactoylglutathione lyase
MLVTAHFSLTVSDLDRSITFYRDVLGMELSLTKLRTGADISQLVGIADSTLKIAYLKLPNAADLALELIEYVSPRGQRVDTRSCNPGNSHICFKVEDMFGVYERLSAQGVHFKSAPVEIQAGNDKGGYAVYFTDPDGISLELLQPPKK